MKFFTRYSELEKQVGLGFRSPKVGNPDLKAIERFVHTAENFTSEFRELASLRWILCERSLFAPWPEVGLIMRALRVVGVIFWNGFWTPSMLWFVGNDVKRCKEMQMKMR